MSNYPQENLVDIAKDFAKAAFKKQDDRRFEDRLVKSSGEEGAYEMLAMSIELVDVKKKFGEKSDQYAEASIVMADKLADIYSRFCSKAEMTDLLPKAAQHEAVADAFEARGASALAKICKP